MCFVPETLLIKVCLVAKVDASCTQAKGLHLTCLTASLGRVLFEEKAHPRQHCHASPACRISCSTKKMV